MHYRYLPAPSIKQYQYMRRLRKSTIAPNMLVELENIFTEVIQKAVLSSSYNKQKFIDLLAVQLEADHHTVVTCTGNVDTMFSIMLVLEVMWN